MARGSIMRAQRPLVVHTVQLPLVVVLGKELKRHIAQAAERICLEHDVPAVDQQQPVHAGRQRGQYLQVELQPGQRRIGPVTRSSLDRVDHQASTRKGGLKLASPVGDDDERRIAMRTQRQRPAA
jgi:hypothetical protein